jgi:6-phosphogluconolactonase (cycloisomerase 2 family)
MPTRESIQHFVDTSEPNGVQPGDEWWNIGTGRYYKRVVFSNGGVGWTEIGQPSLIVNAANTWPLAQTFSSNLTGTTALLDSLIIGSGRSTSVQSILDVKGQVRAPQYIIGNPVSGSSITYAAITANNLLPPPTFHGGTGLLFSSGTKTTGSSPFGIAIDSRGQFVFVTNSGATTVQSYNVNQYTGELTSIGTAPTGTTPYGVAVDPTARFVFVTNNGNATVQSYTIDQSTGNLTSIGTVLTGNNPFGIAVDPTGRFVFVTNNNSNTVQSYNINQNSGALTSIGTATTGNNPEFIAVDPTGRFVFVTNNNGNTVQSYVIDQKSGALSSSGTIATGSNPEGIAVDPTGRFVYVASFGSAYIHGYTINQISGILTLVTIVDTGTNPYGITIHPNGKFLFLTNYGATSVQTYTINQNTGVLTVFETSTAGTNPRCIISDNAGKFIFITNFNSNTVQAYRINNFTSTSGTFQDQLTIGRDTEDGKFKRPVSKNTALDVSGMVRASQYAVGPPVVGGSLTTYEGMSSESLMAPATFHDVPNFLTYSSSLYNEAGTVNNVSSSIAIDPTGRFIARCSINNYFYVYTFDSTTGSIGAIVGGGAYGSWKSVTFDPSGRFFYALTCDFPGSSSTAYIWSYLVNQSTGSLTLLTYHPAPSGAGYIYAEPTGRFVYASSYYTNSISSYKINTLQSSYGTPLYGTLTSVDSVTAAGLRLIANPSGKFLYGTNYYGSTISSLEINSFGQFVSLPVTNLISSNAGQTTLDPTGRFLFLIMTGSGTGQTVQNIHTFSINKNTGTLTFIGYINTFQGLNFDTSGIWCDLTGRYLFISGGYGVETYKINQITGLLTYVSIQYWSVKLPYISAVTVDDRRKFLFTANYVPSANSNALYCYKLSTFGASSGAFSDSLIVGPIRKSSAQSTLDVRGQTRSSQYIIGNTIAGSSITYSSLSSNDIIQRSTFHNGTGLLTSVGTVASGTNPWGVAIDPTGKFLFATNGGSGTVQSYTIHQTTGVLSSVGIVASGTTPQGITVDPTGRFVYVCNSNASGTTPNTVQTYSVNQITGTLTSVGTTSAGTYPLSVICDPTGQVALVTNLNSNTIQTYSIDQTTGLLSSLGTTATNGQGYTSGINPWGIAVHPNGKHVYASISTDGKIEQFLLSINTPLLANLYGTSVTSGTLPAGIAIDPTGRFLISCNYTSGTVSSFSIDRNNGYLTKINDIQSNNNPYIPAIDPTGKFVYISNSANATISVYSIDQYSGLLSFSGTISCGTNPRMIAIDPVGKFLFCANNLQNTIQTFRLNNFSANSGKFLDEISTPYITGNTAVTGQLTQPNLPFVVNDISRYFDGNKASFPLRKDQSALTSLVTSSGTITSIVSNAAQFVVTHSLGTIVPGSYITISGCSTAGYNNAWLVNSSTSTTCTVVTPVNLVSAPATPGTLAGSLTSIVDSKDVEVILNGQYLDPYVTELRYPWISEWDANGGFKVSGSNLILYNAPVSGDKATVKVTGISQSVQTRRYPFSSATIALGE